MSQCLNPDCLHQNPSLTKFCQRCGNKLLLGDRYRAVKYISEGGFGRTFKAVDEHRLDTICVIKQFLPQLQGSAAIQKATELFKQEAVRLRDLGKHPQIPDLLAFFEQDKRFYLVQEFIDGEDLLKELQQQGKFSEKQIKQFLTELLPILDFVHKQKVIHRDIKPDNIIRNSHGSLVLIDFGVAKELSGSVLTRVGTVTGTPGYAPPEQMQGHVFPASDLYSLGVTCIRLLTGCLLEENNGTWVDELFDPMQMAWVWRNKAVSISNDLGKVLDKMLLFPVGSRYQSAAEVLQALNPVSVSPTQILAKPQPKPFQSSSVASNQISASEIMPKQEINEVKLVSAVGMNYIKLRDLLAAGKWKDADEETARVMLKVAGREKQGRLGSSSIDKFPCEDLRTIDQLWVKYSNGRFGFSVQKRIYQSLGGTREYDRKVWDEFGDRVGWRVNSLYWLYDDKLKFNTKAPEGHLPVRVERGCWIPQKNQVSTLLLGSPAVGWWQACVSSLASRLVDCNI
ncbi:MULTISPECIES: serine/threonine-protein kinase [unclassified Microcoleus]|uniref:serine/threonine-protein kinase n=1 Tax=unclassified Microcoleus TaxID=2642155 RepID=UPI002FD223AB